MWAAGAATHTPPAWFRHVILRGLDLSGGVSYTDDIARGLIINPKLRCEASAEPSTIAGRIRVNRVTFVRGIKGTSSPAAPPPSPQPTFFTASLFYGSLASHMNE